MLWRAARWQLVAAVALATLLSLTEGVSLATIFPFIALLGDMSHPEVSTAGLGGRHTQTLFHLLTLAHIPRSEWLAALLVIVLCSVGLLAQWNSLLAVMTTNIVFRIREQLGARIYRSIVHADWTYLVRHRSAELTHYLTDELGRASYLASCMISVLSNGMVAMLMLCLAFYLSAKLTLLVLISFGLMLPWQRRSGRAIYQSGMTVSARMTTVFDSSMERLQNLKIVKAHGAQEAELKLFTSRHHDVITEMIANGWLRTASSRNFQLLSMAVLCGLVLLGLGPLHLTGGAMLIFLFAFLRATPRLSTVQNKMTEVFADLPAYHNIETFIRDCDAHTEQNDVEGVEAPTLQRSLELRGVTFAYSPDARRILNKIDLSFPVGRITALAGSSGSGKSTIADLIMGLLHAQDGTVEADGVAITRENARAWRRHVGYVSQDTHLFHDSIRNNLLWAKPDATDAELAEALEAASAEFVSTLSHGIDTVVGDRGMMLSHGQRQRIALARTMLLRPSLLILDEATNSLDLENEASILKTVRERSGGVTTLLISHRPTAIAVADYVYLLEGGCVSVSGDWRDVEPRLKDQSGEPD